MSRKGTLFLLRKFNFAFIAACIALASCGLFEVRNVQTPNQPRSTFIQPTSPDLVISNLNFAIAEKNVENYMKCFVDSAFSPRRFAFFPDAVSFNSYPVFRTWNLSSERLYYTNLVNLTNENSSSNLFLSEIMITSGIDSAVVDSDYILVYDHNRTSIAKTSRGKLRFIMSPDDRSLWSIHAWYDFIEQTGDTTWSNLKANFIN